MQRLLVDSGFFFALFEGMYNSILTGYGVLTRSRSRLQATNPLVPFL